MEDGLSSLQLDGDWLEHGQLLRGQDGLDGLKVLEVEVKDGQGPTAPGPPVGEGTRR